MTLLNTFVTGIGWGMYDGDHCKWITTKEDTFALPITIDEYDIDLKVGDLLNLNVEVDEIVNVFYITKLQLINTSVFHEEFEVEFA